MLPENPPHFEPQETPLIPPPEVPQRLEAALQRVDSWKFGKREPKGEGADGTPEPFSVAGRKQRFEFLRACVLLGLNAPQIQQLSLNTDRPYTAVRSVYDALESQGLVRLYSSRKIKNRRKGYHNETIIGTFMKIAGHALGSGYELRDVLRDEVPFEGVKFRPDLGLKIRDRQFYVEIQLSKIEYTRWRVKFKNYLKLYRLLGRPFRALFLMDRAESLPDLRQQAREVLAGNPKLNLFLFMPLAEFDRQHDVLHSPCWEAAWTPRQTVSLMG